MSQSPESPADMAGLAEYGDSWKETIKMVRHGTSWSGRERNCVYLNVGNAPSNGNGDDQPIARFANVSSVSGIDFPDDARAMAMIDWDHDGDLDIWLRNRTAPRIRLLRNETNRSRAKNFVAIKLRGATCNLDAIGAVATFSANGILPITQSVRAGDAFVSQSSRWLHFGVAQTGSVEVVWPGGKKERFDGLEPGNRYELSQGTGSPTPQPARVISTPLAAKTISPLPTTDAARIVFPARLPFPPLEFPQGTPAPKREPNVLDQANGNPTLVTFWSNSCPNCRKEIRSFVESKERLERIGLNVVAINIDNLQESEVSSEGLAKEGLPENLRYQTTEASISIVHDLQESLFDKYPPFVVPLSFLLDANRNVLVMYRGAIGLDVVVDDMTVLAKSNVDLRNLASPFAGTWFTKPASDSEFVEYVAKRVFTRDQTAGLYYFEKAIAFEPDTSRQARLRSQLVTTYRKLGRGAGTGGNHQDAESHLQRALKLSNAREKPAVHHDLGVLFASAGNYKAAEQHLLETLKLQPNFPNAKKNLLLVRQKQSQ